MLSHPLLAGLVIAAVWLALFLVVRGLTYLGEKYLWPARVNVTPAGPPPAEDHPRQLRASWSGVRSAEADMERWRAAEAAYLTARSSRPGR